ncbi:hypothetical protein EDB81DRAFT_858821 [Dactylonectria macrodidyma]|uniref:Uncharacterized protein n=1 Tax=Dactylonectria macrodidyma TaxID=307937 RepID=A0A9P9EBM8_9HYPO|nr:hypothetical protein EDB81DRAFT_858821 [Dactylonectria macrodidyma]
MEAFAAIQIISSIVQLVEFGYKCVAKGVELYQSTDGVLDENAAVQIAVVHLTTLNDEVGNAVCSTTDEQLRDLCSKVTEVSSELLKVLERVGVHGTKTKWKSMRKAIKNVWGKEKVKELESNLASIRDTLNLHICVRMRQQLEGLQTQVATRFDNCDAQTKEVLDTIVNGGDVFNSVLTDQTVLICSLHEETRRCIQQNHDTTRLELHQVTTHLEQTNQDEHAKTRQEIEEDANRVIASHIDSNREVFHMVQLAEANLHETTEINAEANAIQHEQTQSQIAELKEALRQLSSQIKARDQELQDLLTAFTKSKSQKKRKLLRERSNAVSAALFALRTMHDSLQEMLENFQSKVAELISKARSGELWQVTRHIQRSASSHHHEVEMSSLGLGDTGAKDDHGQSQTTRSYYAHQVYYGYYYPWVDTHSKLVDPATMEQKWYFRNGLDTSDIPCTNYDGIRVDDSYCDCKALWLLSAVNAAIIRNFTPAAASFTLISEIFDRDRGLNGTHAYSEGIYSARLKADLGYWTSFAKMRGMLDDLSNDSNNTIDLISFQDKPGSNGQPELSTEPKFDLGQLTLQELQDLHNLLDWLIGNPNFGWIEKRDIPSTVCLEPEGPASYVAEALRSMGLQMFPESNLDALVSSPNSIVWYSGQEPSAGQVGPMIRTISVLRSLQ